MAGYSLEISDYLHVSLNFLEDAENIFFLQKNTLFRISALLISVQCVVLSAGVMN